MVGAPAQLGTKKKNCQIFERATPAPAMETKLVSVANKGEMNFIFGQSHFIKTVEDLYEALVQVGHLRFGIVCLPVPVTRPPPHTHPQAFCEASGPCLVRTDGNDEEAIELAKQNALNVSAAFARRVCPHTTRTRRMTGTATPAVLASLQRCLCCPLYFSTSHLFPSIRFLFSLVHFPSHPPNPSAWLRSPLVTPPVGTGCVRAHVLHLPQRRVPRQLSQCRQERP